MMRPVVAFAVGVAAPWTATAQVGGLECSFTLVCAPQIDCVPHEGVPFTLMPGADGTLGFDRDGRSYTAAPLARAEGAPLTVLFEDGTGSLLFTVADTGSAVLTEHRVTGAGRVEHSSFSGTCEVM